MGNLGIKIQFIALLLMVINPMNASALTSEEHFSTSRGTQFVIITETDSKDVYKTDNVRIKMSVYPTSFGSNVRDIHDITYAIKIESGTYIRNQQQSYSSSVDNVNYGIEDVFNFRVDNDIPKNPQVYVRVLFREDIALSIDSYIDTGWVFVFTLNVYPSIETIIGTVVMILAIMIGLIIYFKSRKKPAYPMTTQSSPVDNANHVQSPILKPQKALDITPAFCSNCGSKSRNDDDFCSKCGSKLL